ncbi:serine/threonine protein kinase [Gloeothece citriformis PCC 7424]|uniref:Serine/threonine protein kinase n=1 Tax=Gloeothece citriformis (strain PCC 7424) TaxID=65393 RepID=B7KH55_GLOC7|nr:serine/threonine-protein kinase [Gloeothece citriformis]ACK69264.1 serine/threonine protein kinase [Gloeothece citriformis PCC 7424]
MKCCIPNPSCLNFCRLDGRLISGQGVIRNPLTGWEYEVLKVLARGGMGTTYLVYNYQIRRLAVLKEMNAKMASKAKARELFQREARILQSLEHRGIPRFYDFFWTEQHYSLLMEMVHGYSLEEVLPLDPSQAIEWMLQLTDILDYLHQRNPPVIHRDIKPSNLLLRYNPREIVLIDFGAVKEATAPPGTRIVTPGYGAPEQQKGLCSVQSDFYALGTTLVYLLTRQYPNKLYLFSKGQFVNLESAGVPPILIGVINTLTSFNPHERPQSATEVRDILTASLKALA